MVVVEAVVAVAVVLTQLVTCAAWVEWVVPQHLAVLMLLLPLPTVAMALPRLMVTASQAAMATPPALLVPPLGGKSVVIS